MGAALHLRATLLPDGDAPVDLWVAGGRVSFAPVAGAVEADVRDGFALPGLVDAHTHLTTDTSATGLAPGSTALVEANLQRHLAAGELALRDIGGVTLAALAFQGREEWPALEVAGRFLAPTGRYLPFGEWCDGPGLVAAAAGHLAAGARWVKVIADWPGKDGIRANYDPGDLARVVEAAHAAGARVAVHVAGPEGSRLGVEAGVDSIEHGDGLDADDLALLARRGTAWTPTIAMYPDMIRSSVSRPESAARLIHERDERMRWMVPGAARLGVTILAGTDTLPKGSAWREVEALVRYGLAPRTALAAASTAARAFLGLPGIADGARADLVLYRADPRNDPEILARPALILREGRRIAT